MLTEFEPEKLYLLIKNHIPKLFCDQEFKVILRNPDVITFSCRKKDDCSTFFLYTEKFEHLGEIGNHQTVEQFIREYSRELPVAHYLVRVSDREIQVYIPPSGTALASFMEDAIQKHRSMLDEDYQRKALDHHNWI